MSDALECSAAGCHNKLEDASDAVCMGCLGEMQGYLLAHAGHGPMGMIFEEIEERGWTISKLSERSLLSLGKIVDLATGASDFDAATIKALAKALDVPELFLSRMNAAIAQSQLKGDDTWLTSPESAPQLPDPVQVDRDGPGPT